MQRIPTLSPRLDILRIEGSESFRPSAAGESTAETELRVRMEQLEIEASRDQSPGFIASAAHPEKSQAIKNAMLETVERVSLAAWWAAHRPVTARPDPELIEALRSDYLYGNEYLALHIGFIEPACGSGYAAAAILSDPTAYPYTALGGAFEATPQLSANKAFIEAMQSWTATQWLRKHRPHDTPAWDIGELRQRIVDIEQAPVLEDANAGIDGTAFDAFFADKTVHVKDYPEGSVAWVYGHETASGTTRSLARFALRDSEHVSVYTSYNW